MNFKLWIETLALKGNYKNSWFIKLVAAQYKLSPVFDASAVPAYEDLANKMARQYEFLSSKYEFRPSFDDPYKSMKAMTADIRSQNVKKPIVKVFAEPPGPEGTPEKQGHPIFSNDFNVKIRGVHDVIAHYFGQHPFSARGEFGAYNRHLKTLCNIDQAKSGKCLAADALFTEIVGQTSYFYIYGDYPEQKIIILNDFDHYNIGKLNPNSPLNEFFIVIGKQMVPTSNFANIGDKFPELAKELKV